MPSKRPTVGGLPPGTSAQAYSDFTGNINWNRGSNDLLAKNVSPAPTPVVQPPVTPTPPTHTGFGSGFNTSGFRGGAGSLGIRPRTYTE